MPSPKLAFLAVVALGGPAPARAEAPLKISFLLASMEAERYDTDRAGFVAAAEKDGATVLFASAGGDPDRQERELAEHLRQGVRVVVLQAVDVLRAVPLLEMARQRHVPVVAYDRLVTGRGVALYVTHDHTSLGALQAEALRESRPKNVPRGRVVICMGQRDSRVTQDITQANVAGLKAAGWSDVVPVAHAGWAADECEATVLRELHHGPLEAVLANNSRMALGALEALDAFNAVAPAGHTFVAGGDATQESCRELVRHRLDVDVFKPIAALAAVAAHAAVRIARGEDVAVTGAVAGVPTVALPVSALRADNARQVIAASDDPGRAALLRGCGL